MENPRPPKFLPLFLLVLLGILGGLYLLVGIGGTRAPNVPPATRPSPGKKNGAAPAGKTRAGGGGLPSARVPLPAGKEGDSPLFLTIRGKVRDNGSNDTSFYEIRRHLLLRHPRAEGSFPVFPDYSRTKKRREIRFPLPPPFSQTESRGILPLSTALEERGKAMADFPDKSPFEGWPPMEAICEAASAMARALLPFKPFLAHEAADLALALLEDKILEGWKPRDPIAWIRGVAKKEALHLASTRKTRPASLEALGPEQQESLLRPSDLRLSTPPEWKETLLNHEKRSLQNLTPRQRKAYWAYRLEESVKKAARRAGMTERDLRVAKKEIAKKIRKSLPPPPTT